MEMGLIQFELHSRSLQDLIRASEGVFVARKRHLDAIDETLEFINNGISQLNAGSSELSCRRSSSGRIKLGQITGEFSSDDLLGEIFSSFCIGK